MKNVTKSIGKTDGKIVVNQHCNSAAVATEISCLKKEVKKLTHRLDKISNKGVSKLPPADFSVQVV